MSEETTDRLLEAAEKGTVDDVRAAFEAYRIDERKEHGYTALSIAAKNSSPHAFEMVKLLIEKGVKPDYHTLHDAVDNLGPCALEIMKLMIEQGVEPNCETLNRAVANHGPYVLEIMELLIERGVKPDCQVFRHAVWNRGPHALDIMRFLIEQGAKPDCYAFHSVAWNTSPDALDVIKLMIECGADPHWKNDSENTVFIKALCSGNTVVADYLFSRDDFLLSDIIPRPRNLSTDIYKTYRGKAISRVSELIDANGIHYAQTIAVDIEKILNTENPEPTKEDIEALQLLAKKITSKDWVRNTHISSDEFLAFGMTR